MSFEELLKNLHKEYVAALPEKVTEIKRLMSQGDVVALREMFHKLKGTGKTYGLPEVSEIAAKMELICKDYPDQAIAASNEGVSLLADIHRARREDAVFALSNDPRFKSVCQILNH